MDLQAVIRRSPSHTGPQQLGHARFKIAAPAIVLLPSGEVGQLTGDHDLDSHHCQLAGHPREGHQGLAELLAILGVLHPDIERRLGHADGARRCLDTGAFEGLHELLEALAFFAAQQVFTLHFEIVEIDRVFLHAPIAEHFDLTAGNAGILPRLLIRAGRFLCQEHGQAAMVCRVWHRACQHRHHMGARRMGDPGFVAVQRPVTVGAFHGLGAQCAQIRAGVGLCEHGGGEDLTGGKPRQPLFLLRIRAATNDQFCRNLGTGAEGANADIAT